MLCLASVVACTDELGTDQTGTENPLNQDKGIGELVLFSSGNTGNITTRATVCPYMELDGRFVCKMYYHAKATDTDASEFEVENTPITSWLRVNNDEGNSVYWQKDFDMNVDETHQDFLDYGFDSRAQYFYWRNRLDHIFLAYTDYNLLKENKWEWSTNTDKDGNTLPKSRSLFMYPDADGSKKTKTGEEVSWPLYSYRKLNFKTAPEKIDQIDYIGCTEQDTYPYPSTTTSLQLHYLASNYDDVCPPTLAKINEIIQASKIYTDEEKEKITADLARTSNSDPIVTADGTFRDEEWRIVFDPEKVDPVTHCVDLSDPLTVIYTFRKKQKIEDIIAVAPANTFDMRFKEGMESMSDQPDPLIAWTRMKPSGATQEANRVRLHFEHQFSQIQVNLTNAKNTSDIKPENIIGVELLGVTETGYVFTNINPDGSKIAPSYEPVVISKYTDDELKANPYGTSFPMFDMKTAKPETSLKSFNAIAFGQLQAIRIMWKEEDVDDILYTAEQAAEENAKHQNEEGYTPVTAGDVMVSGKGVVHSIIRKITVDDRGQSLVNLKSGYRYVYDFELQRGTIAFIRAIIEGWLMSEDLNYGTSGTINE